VAIQKSSITLEGQIGDLSFYKSNGKALVRQRTGASKERIKTAPSFARTRENNTEFGRASSAGKRIRVAARLALGERYTLFEDPTAVNRLTTRMTAVVRSDTTHGRGERTVLPENLPLLHGFSFNAVAALKDVLFIPPRCAYQRETGLLEVMLPALSPDNVMAAPKGVERCSFHVGAILFNTGVEPLPVVAQHQELLPMNRRTIPAQSFRLELPEASADPVIICFGISFYRNLGGYPVPIQDQGRNVFEVIGVDVTAG